MKKIGLLDSGFGGLTVLKEVMRQLPNVSCEYFGDSGRNPYGHRSEEEITKFTRQILDFLSQKSIELAIIACNTATAAALEEVENKYDFPVLGIIEPGSKAALKVTSNKEIGVIATDFTIKSGAYQETITKLDEEAKVIAQACPPFCDLVEEGKTEGNKVERIVSKYVSVFKDYSIDTLVLGCTHYPVLLPLIKKNISQDITIVDPAEEVVAQAKDILKIKDTNLDTQNPEYRFYTSGKAQIFSEIGGNILGRPIEHLEEIDWDTME